MKKETNKTELGVIRTLANTEDKLRKAERELIDNMFMPLSEEEHKKVFLEIGKNIVNGKEELQEIKEKKVQELINKHTSPNDELFSKEQIKGMFIALEETVRVVTYWVKVTQTSDTNCRIIDRYTGVELLETHVAVAQRIIVTTFNSEVN